MKNCVFLAASAQHVGKTSASVGVVRGVQRMLFQKNIRGTVGYMKPVGQKSVCMPDGDKMVHVDKDVPVFKEILGCTNSSYREMNPVLIGKSYTRRYLDGEISSEMEFEQIRKSFESIVNKSAFTVVEGTGHVGVGSLVGLGNAHIAGRLGIPMVLVLNGGIGSTIDEFVMNRELCLAEGAVIRGVILNKVKPEKLNDIVNYTGDALQRYFDCPILGTVPDIEAVSKTKHVTKLNIEEEDRLEETATHYSNHIDIPELIESVNRPDFSDHLAAATYL